MPSRSRIGVVVLGAIQPARGDAARIRRPRGFGPGDLTLDEPGQRLDLLRRRPRLLLLGRHLAVAQLAGRPSPSDRRRWSAPRATRRPPGSGRPSGAAGRGTRRSAPHERLHQAVEAVGRRRRALGVGGDRRGRRPRRLGRCGCRGIRRVRRLERHGAVAGAGGRRLGPGRRRRRRAPDRPPRREGASTARHAYAGTRPRAYPETRAASATGRSACVAVCSIVCGGLSCHCRGRRAASVKSKSRAHGGSVAPQVRLRRYV